MVSVIKKKKQQQNNHLLHFNVFGFTTYIICTLLKFRNTVQYRIVTSQIKLPAILNKKYLKAHQG